MKPSQFTIEVAGMFVQVTRKSIKNLYLRVDAQTGQARITAPIGLSTEKIQDFARKHADWLAGRMRTIKEEAQTLSEIIPERQKIWGIPYKVEVQTGQDCYDVKLADGKMVISTPGQLEFGQWRAILDAFLRDLVHTEAPGLIEAWSKKLKLAMPSFGVRRMKKRWGTCYPTRKRIILNSAIAAYPCVCLEAVIVHELLHFRVPNHGPAFRALLEQALPGWQKIDALLR